MQPKNMNAADVQRAVEYTYGRNNINKVVLHDITSSDLITELVDKAVIALQEYLNKTYRYESKNVRVSFLSDWDEPRLRELVYQVMVVVCQCQKATLFTSVAGQLAGMLGYPDKIDGLKTISEILAVCCHCDLFDIDPPTNTVSGSLEIRTKYFLEKETYEFIYNTKYLPPMVCEPDLLVHNRSCGYLTKTESVILGSGNHHEYPLALDALNIMNSVPLSLDVKLLTTFSMAPSKKQTSKEALEQFEAYAKQSYKVYKDLIHQGNLFYLTHKPDERGRSYAQGYHVNTQGNSFRKAIVNLAHQEIIEGI